MTKSISNYKEFNPFTETLAEGYRLRLLDGKLTVESSDFRKTQMYGWERFWTRGQYSQSAILEKMNMLYEKQIGEDVNRETFIENFKSLEGRATAQNIEFKKVNPIVRFFQAKSRIDVDAFHNKFIQIDATFIKAEHDKIIAESRANLRRAEQIADEQRRQAEKQAARDGIQAELDAKIKPFQDHIATYTKELKELDVDLMGQVAYDQKISNLKAKISLAEKAIEASERTRAWMLRLRGLQV